MFRIAPFAAALVLAAAATPLAAEVVETKADGFVTRDSASVKATPLATWLALTRPALWWSDKHSWSGDAKNMTLTPQGGGCFCERIPVGDSGNASAMEGSAQHATVVQAFPMRVLRMRGGFGPLQGEPAEGVLTITLKEVSGGTRIVWEYNVGGPMRYKVGEIAPAVDAVMSEQMKRLHDHLGALDEDGGRPRLPLRQRMPRPPQRLGAEPSAAFDVRRETAYTPPCNTPRPTHIGARWRLRHLARLLRLTLCGNHPKRAPIRQFGSVRQAAASYARQPGLFVLGTPPSRRTDG